MPRGLTTDIAALQRRIAELTEENRRLRSATANRRKLTASEVKSIRVLHRTGRFTQRHIADIYAVNPATVSRIVRDLYWPQPRASAATGG
ncbi:helix-turn-helix domain-containing protein [Pseudonocardiaceae bacterium YIM PH 21723]|nr:helix-turn-helix domain-containing protein [Pseudonocardiaceae bacterium YIM PH 21723]